MATDVLIIGESGSGKSTSYRNLDPKETFIFNCSKKPLPFKGSASMYTKFNPQDQTGNLFSSINPESIIKIISWIGKASHIKNVILDDANFIMQQEFISRAFEKGYDKYNSIGANFSNVILALKNLPSDKFIFVSMHPDIATDADGNKIVKPKTVGTMVDRYLDIPGMFSIVLGTKVKITDDYHEYIFVTQRTNSEPLKSPMGMLELEEPNDLKVIRDKIIDYYN